MKTFLDFINEKQSINDNLVNINEAFKAQDTEKVIGLIDKLLRKHVKPKLLQAESVPTKTIVGGKTSMSYMWVTYEGNGKFGTLVSLDYQANEKRGDVYSISFIDGSKAFGAMSGKKVKADLVIYTMGSSIVHFLPAIYTVLNTKNYALTQDDIEKEHKKIFKESIVRKFYIGALEYEVYENLDQKLIDETFNYALEARVDADVRQYQAKKRGERNRAWDKWRDDKSAENKAERDRITREYDELNQAIQGGATTMEKLKLAIKQNIDFEVPADKETQEVEKIFQTEHKDPERAFKEMTVYVNSVLRGLQPGVILCGAPGVGKTYRVLQQLKAKGKVNGQNMDIIKGKCTPRELYKSLYKFQDKGNIVVIDDADSLVGPKAPEDCINILKAALDSTSDDEGRLVSYKISGDLKDEEGIPIPKSFHYRGGVIVITNYAVGQLDTAVRGRVFTQSLDFTTDELVDLIKDLIPKMAPTKLSMKSKMKAYEFIKKLVHNKVTIEISIRSFATCANLYELTADDPDITDKDVESMIKEQLNNQTFRGGKKY